MDTSSTVAFAICVIAVAITGIGYGMLGRQDWNQLIQDSKSPPSVPLTSQDSKSPPSVLLTSQSVIYTPPTPAKERTFRFASVASDSPPCSTIGTEIMVRHGGSAMDAAIAAVLCAGVHNPQCLGVGGGFIMTYYKRDERKAYTINAREMAPAGATQNMYKGTGVSSREGGMSIGIPGQVKGLYEAWRLGGRLPWEVLFRPAIKMAQDGFTVGPLLDEDLRLFTSNAHRYPRLKHLITNPSTGKRLKLGDTLRMPLVAETLKRIAADPFTFYNGSLAQDVVDDIAEAGGIITLDDLKAYTASVEDPVAMDLEGFRMYTPPPPSSGVIIQFILNILQGYRFSRDSIVNVDSATEMFHRIIEALKHAFALRTNLGDSRVEDQTFKDTQEQLVANMTSPEFGAKRRRRITDSTYNSDYYEPTYASSKDGGTSHTSVLGGNGDAVSVTSTINYYFGSNVVGGRTGILFNNNMDDFSTPNVTNCYGFSASPANFIKPYKRPLSSMAPTIFVDNGGDVKLVLGSSGGSKIISSMALTSIYTLWLDLGLKEALEVPLLHHQLMPNTIEVEPAFPQAIITALKARGHAVSNYTIMPAVTAVLQRKFGDILACCHISKFGDPDGV